MPSLAGAIAGEGPGEHWSVEAAGTDVGRVAEFIISKTMGSGDAVTIAGGSDQ